MAELLADSGHIALQTCLVLDELGAATDLELASDPIAARDDVVHENAWVSQQIMRLSRAEHHRQPQLAIKQERFNRTHPRSSVTPDRRNQDHSRRYEPLLSEISQVGLVFTEFAPCRHGEFLRRPTDNADRAGAHTPMPFGALPMIALAAEYSAGRPVRKLGDVGRGHVFQPNPEPGADFGQVPQDVT